MCRKEQKELSVGNLASWSMSEMGPAWVKTGKLNASKCFPLCPSERTSRNAVGMSVSCQQRK